MSNVLKAHQLTIAGSWRPQPIPEPVKRQTPAVDEGRRRQEIDEYFQAAQAKATKLLIDARNEADAILAQAEAELENQREKGYHAGFESGLEVGKKEGEATWRAQLDELESMRQQLIAKDASWLHEAEQEMSELTLAVVERVLHCKLRHDDAVLQAALRQVLAAAQDCREALLLTSEADFSLIWEQRSHWKNSLPGVKDFSIQPAAELESGDLVLQTDQGTIDARVDTVVEQVVSRLAAEGQA